MTRVLVVRLDSDGDVLLAGPAVRAVAARADEVIALVGPRGRRQTFLCLLIHPKGGLVAARNPAEPVPRSPLLPHRARTTRAACTAAAHVAAPWAARRGRPSGPAT